MTQLLFPTCEAELLVPTHLSLEDSSICEQRCCFPAFQECPNVCSMQLIYIDVVSGLEHIDAILLLMRAF